MIKPTPSELEILQILWKYGNSKVQFVNDKLNENKTVGYTTTLKLMQIMFEKKMLERIKDGKSHIYRAIIEESQIQKDMLSRFIETAFGGSKMKLVMQLFGNNKTSAEEIEKIRNYLDQLEKGQNS